MQNEDYRGQLKEKASTSLLAVFTTIAAPFFAMLVVISIAWFLIDIFCDGPYVGRIKWVFAFFGFASVLVSRISISEGPGRAALFGLLLGIPTVAVAAFAMQGNLLLLIAIVSFVWWCAGRLTWDCTFVDSSRDATGQGMVDLAIERIRGSKDLKGSEPVANGKNESRLPPHQQASLTGKLRRFFFQRRQSNTPGLWALYFLMGGIVFFGLGQTLIPVHPPGKHAAIAFNVLCYYVGILGLLLVTAITGLFRYLERRRGILPPRIARRWMTTGIVIALLVVIAGWLLPRPRPEFSLGGLAGQFGFRERDPSDLSVGKDGQKEKDDESGHGGSGKQQEDGEGSGSQEGEQEDGSKSAESGPKDGKGDKQQSAADGEGKSASGKSAENRKKPGNKSDKKEEESGESGGESAGNQSGGQSAQQPGQDPPPQQKPEISSALETTGKLVKFLLWMAAIAAALFFLFRYRSRLAPWFHSFLAELFEWWNRLFGRKGKPANAVKPADRTAVADPRRNLPGFNSYANPFQSGAAKEWPLERLVFYTWEAVEAWSRERNRPRLPEQTVLEFSRSTGEAFELLAAELADLATMYSELNYSGTIKSTANAAGLSRLWERLSSRAPA